MSLRSLMAHTAWMGCGSSATPPSLCPSTGATASCLQSLASPSLCSGASCLRASPSATSGLWFPASRAVWLSRSASAASTPSAFKPSAIPSSKPWARSSAVCVLHCAKKSKYSHSSVYSMIGWSTVSFYTPKDQSWHIGLLLPPPRPFIKCCTQPCHSQSFPLSVLTWLVCLLPPEALWQLQQAAWFPDSSGTPGGLSAPHWRRERRAACHEEDRLLSFIWIPTTATHSQIMNELTKHCCTCGHYCLYALHLAFS